MPDRIVVNTSCLIALKSIQHLTLLDELYDELMIPAAVEEEFGSVDLESKKYMEVHHSLIKLLRNDLNLGKGESEVIAFAHQEQLPAIIDDQKARGVAKELDVIVTGTIGVLLKAEETENIDSAFENVKTLRNRGFYVSEDLLENLRGK